MVGLIVVLIVDRLVALMVADVNTPDTVNFRRLKCAAFNTLSDRVLRHSKSLRCLGDRITAYLIVGWSRANGQLLVAASSRSDGQSCRVGWPLRVERVNSQYRPRSTRGGDCALSGMYRYDCTMTESIGTISLGEVNGWERTGVRIGTDRYLILTKPARNVNAEVVGYRARLVSLRIHTDADTAIRAALRAIERLPVDPIEF